MKKLTGIAAAAIMAATVGGGLAVPTAANAQVSLHFGSPSYWTPERTNSIRRQIWQLDRQIDRAEQRRQINRWEARRLHRDVRVLRNNYSRYAYNGLTMWEVRTLQHQVNRVRHQLRMSRLDWHREDYWRGDRWRDHDRGGYGHDYRYGRDYDDDGRRDDDNDGVPDWNDRYDYNPRRY
jgi:hypothetical protein